MSSPKTRKQVEKFYFEKEMLPPPCISNLSCICYEIGKYLVNVNEEICIMNSLIHFMFKPVRQVQCRNRSLEVLLVYFQHLSLIQHFEILQIHTLFQGRLFKEYQGCMCLMVFLCYHSQKSMVPKREPKFFSTLGL